MSVAGTHWPDHGQIVDFVTGDGKYHSGVYDANRRIFWEETALSGIGQSQAKPYETPNDAAVYTHDGILDWAAHKENR